MYDASLWHLRQFWQLSKMHDGRSATEWFILWKHKPAEEATWEEESMIRGQFPKLEDSSLNISLLRCIIGLFSFVEG